MERMEMGVAVFCSIYLILPLSVRPKMPLSMVDLPIYRVLLGQDSDRCSGNLFDVDERNEGNVE